MNLHIANDTTLNQLKEKASEEMLESMMITITLPGTGSTEITGFLIEGKLLLSVQELFNFVEIKNSLLNDEGIIEGFYINSLHKYQINPVTHFINFKNINYKAAPNELLFTAQGTMLSLKLLQDIFGLSINFNFRNLAASISTQQLLPVVLNRQRLQVRENIQKLIRKPTVDTVVTQPHYWFKAGTLGWSAVNTLAKGSQSSSQFNLQLQTMLAGGELNIAAFYNSISLHQQKKFWYNWRYINNKSKALSQVILGRIYSPSAATLLHPLTGIQFSNTPVSRPVSFGTWRITEKTEPGWTVEIYLNNILVGFTQADAAGVYSIELPLQYGLASVKTRMYGPWGEQKNKEETVNIPFNFLPARRFEYNASAAVTGINDKDRFARFAMGYGLSNKITIGAGAEYSVAGMYKNKNPFASIAIRPFSSLMIAAEITHGIKKQLTVNYRLPLGIQLDGKYIWYTPGQTAFLFGFLKEYKAELTLPVKTGQLSSFIRLSQSGFTLPKTAFRNTLLLYTASVGKYSANVTANLLSYRHQKPIITTGLAVSRRFAGYWRVSLQAQQNAGKGIVNFLGAQVDKRLGKRGYLSASYQSNLLTQSHQLNFSIRLNLGFAFASWSMFADKNSFASTQTMQGTVWTNNADRSLHFANENLLNTAAIALVPFLDINHNGKQDVDEPRVAGLSCRVQGGMVSKNLTDTAITITALEPYTHYLIEMSDKDIENIAWQLPHKNWEINTAAGAIQKIMVPIWVSAEATGKVMLQQKNGESSLARLIVHLTTLDGKNVSSFISDESGDFNFFGLRPGTYIVTANEKQLNKLNYMQTDQVTFTITQNIQGDIVSNLKLIIRNKN